MSSRVYSAHNSELGPLLGGVSNCMPIVLVLSQTTIFFTITKPTQYIYILPKMMKRRSRIQGRSLKNHYGLAEIQPRSDDFTGKRAMNSVSFIGNGEYPLEEDEELSSKRSSLAEDDVKNDQNLREKVAAAELQQWRFDGCLLVICRRHHVQLWGFSPWGSLMCQW